MSIYLDHASTAYPKAPGVAEAMASYLTGIGTNIGRGSYRKAYEAEELVYETRVQLCDLFHGPDPKNVIFTKNVTESLNFLIKGLLKEGGSRSCILHGAQCGDASAHTDDCMRRHFYADPLRQGRTSSDRENAFPCPPGNAR